MHRCIFERAESARAFTDEISAAFLPINLLGVAGRGKVNRTPVNEETPIYRLHLSRETAMHRIKLEHVGQVLGRHAAVNVSDSLTRTDKVS